MSDRFVVEGGRPLSGTVKPSGNKNEALPVIMATLLTDKEVKLRNIPRILDVLTTCEILKTLGARVEWNNDTDLTIEAKDIDVQRIPHDLCKKIRASILLMGPLLARAGEFHIAVPGGDVIGARRIDTHWEGIVELGGDLKMDQGIRGSAKKLRGKEIFLDEPSVTATENLLMLAVLAEGETILHNAACEPHVVGLCRMLVAMGAKISGIGSNRVNITGVSSLSGCDHSVGSDFMEVGSFVCLSAISEGDIKIDASAEDLRFVLKTFERLGIDVSSTKQGLQVASSSSLKMKKDISGRVGTIYSGPWPAFPTDLMSVSIVAATQCHGTQVFFEKMFESRMFFTDKLMAMGANIVLCDPHRVVVTGPSPLYGAHLSSPDVRAGMALLMATLIAQGRSEIDNIYQIERGYANIAEKLEGLGAAIKKVKV